LRVHRKSLSGRGFHGSGVGRDRRFGRSRVRPVCQPVQPLRGVLLLRRLSGCLCRLRRGRDHGDWRILVLGDLSGFFGNTEQGEDRPALRKAIGADAADHQDQEKQANQNRYAGGTIVFVELVLFLVSILWLVFACATRRS
jgi:hypothetical protein